MRPWARSVSHPFGVQVKIRHRLYSRGLRPELLIVTGLRPGENGASWPLKSGGMGVPPVDRPKACK